MHGLTTLQTRARRRRPLRGHAARLTIVFAVAAAGVVLALFAAGPTADAQVPSCDEGEQSGVVCWIEVDAPTTGLECVLEIGWPQPEGGCYRVDWASDVGITCISPYENDLGNCVVANEENDLDFECPMPHGVKWVTEFVTDEWGSHTVSCVQRAGTPTCAAPLLDHDGRHCLEPSPYYIREQPWVCVEGAERRGDTCVVTAIVDGVELSCSEGILVELWCRDVTHLVKRGISTCPVSATVFVDGEECFILINRVDGVCPIGSGADVDNPTLCRRPVDLRPGATSCGPGFVMDQTAGTCSRFLTPDGMPTIDCRGADRPICDGLVQFDQAGSQESLLPNTPTRITRFGCPGGSISFTIKSDGIQLAKGFLIEEAPGVHSAIVESPTGGTISYVSYGTCPEGSAFFLVGYANFETAQPPSPSPIVELCPGDNIEVALDAGTFDLLLGTTPGTDDLAESLTITETGATVGDLPFDVAVFAIVHGLYPYGERIVVDKIEFSSCTKPFATITAPTPRTPLCVGDVISWDGPSSTYRVDLDLARHGESGYVQQTLPAGTNEFLVENLIPGSDTFVRLSHQLGDGSWRLAETARFLKCDLVPGINTPVDGGPLCAGDDLELLADPILKYRIRIGTRVDGADVANINVPRSTRHLPVGEVPPGLAIYVTVSNRQADGSYLPIQRLRYLPCDAESIVLTSPIANTTLCPGDRLRWEGPAEGRYQIRIGTTADGNDILSKQTSARELVLSDLGTESEVHISLRHRSDDGSWVLYDQNVYRRCEAEPLDIRRPVDGLELCSGDTISWDDAGGGRYQIRIGTTLDGNDILTKQTNNTALSIGELPADTDLFVSLRHRPEDGSWALQDQVTYLACTAEPILISAPTSGAELCIGDRLTWNAADGGRYRIRIGTTADGFDVANIATAGTALTIDELAVDTDVFVSLRHRPDGGTWTLHDQVTYLACTALPIAVSAPASGAQLCSGSTISWDDAGGGRYQIRIGTTPDGNDILSKQTNNTALSIGELPADTDLFVSLRHRPEDGSWTLHDQVTYLACAPG